MDTRIKEDNYMEKWMELRDKYIVITPLNDDDYTVTLKVENQRFDVGYFAESLYDAEWIASMLGMAIEKIVKNESKNHNVPPGTCI
jgi:hypothetical protein